jgi:hypothetical protein
LFHHRENIVIKRAENVYPVTSEDSDVVGVVASYVHGKVAVDVMPANIEVSRCCVHKSLSRKGLLSL